MQKKLFINGKIYTVHRDFPEVEAIAVTDGDIVDIGSSMDLIDKYNDFEVIDLNKQRVLPSFIDSHVHFLAYCSKQGLISLDGLSLEKCINDVKNKVNTVKPDEWVLGQGWNKNLWKNSEFPDRFMLDSVSPDNPVCLESRDFHTTWINSKALSLIHDKSSLISNPLVKKDVNGLITGIFFEDSRKIVWDLIPKPTTDNKKNYLKTGLDLAYQNGLSGIHTIETLDDFTLYQELEKEGYPLRVSCYLPACELDKLLTIGLKSGDGNEWLKFGGIKFFVDGALGSQTALMYEPYDNSNNYGEQCIAETELETLVNKANKNGIACAIHAIGDKANSIALNAILKSPNKQIRNRIEHAQLINENDFAKFKGTIASTQPIHIREDIAPANLYWGNRSKNAFPLRTLLQNDAILAFGSDAPVETPNVFEGIYAALLRTSRKGGPSWHPEQKLKLQEIIHAYTLGSAYASSTENNLGSIEIGKKADFMILSEDIFSLNLEFIPDIYVKQMIIDGKTVYNKL